MNHFTYERDQTFVYKFLYQKLSFNEENTRFQMEKKLLESKQTPTYSVAEYEKFIDSQILLNQIERSVSILQCVLFQFQKVQNNISDALTDYQQRVSYHNAREMFEELNHKITRCLTTTSFDGISLLDCHLSIFAKGENCQAVQIPSQTPDGSKIQIEALQAPLPSVLYGTTPLTQDLIENETHVGFYESGKTAVYCISPNETIESFLLHAQRMIFKNGLALDLSMTSEGTLKIQHTEKSEVLFFGYSEKTTLISVSPGVMQTSKVGKAGVAKINSYHASWQGHYIKQKTEYGFQILWYGNQLGKKTLTVKNNTKWILDHLESQSQKPLYLQIPLAGVKEWGGILDDGNWHDMQRLPELSQTSKLQTEKLCYLILKTIQADIEQINQTILKLQKSGMLLLAGKPPQESSLEKKNKTQNEYQMMNVLQKCFLINKEHS